MGATEDVIAERKRQVSAEGYGPSHDDLHSEGELAKAAAAYLLGRRMLGGLFESVWPWGVNEFKPKRRRRDLVRAAALVIAEIERLDRMCAAEEGGE